ncbi:DUF982 domain-containing protein, partial [Allomesorhizobium alhagi]
LSSLRRIRPLNTRLLLATRQSSSVDAQRFWGVSMVKLEDGIFDPAVKVQGAPAGQVQHIGSARKAAEWLINKWPMKIDTAKARAAHKACLEVLGGQRKAAAARQAFRDAAEEAGILIGDDNTPPPKPMMRKT